MQYLDDTLKNLTDWFYKYTETFLDGTELQRRAIQLKIDHTIRVCENNELLCVSIHASREITVLSAIVALLHDIGRFEQFKKYGTFSDHQSVNHGLLGVKIIDDNKLLSAVNAEHAELITGAIRYHNVNKLPDTLDDQQALLCHLIRDADKIDIYKIAADHYSNPVEIDRGIIGIGTSDSSDISGEICTAIKDRKSVDYSRMRSLTDFKLVQLGWVNDLNFVESLSLIVNRKHYDIIKQSLPEHPKITEIIQILDAHVRERLG